jgi:predicted aspartyl protease
MGVIALTVQVRNILTHGPVVDLPAKVDTAATLLVLPGSVAEELGLPRRMRCSEPSSWKRWT